MTVTTASSLSSSSSSSSSSSINNHHMQLSYKSGAAYTYKVQKRFFGYKRESCGEVDSVKKHNYKIWLNYGVY